MDRKEEILDHASELLQSRGYGSFSYKDLSERLGICKATIHHHFASKEALGEALIDRYLNGFLAFRADVDAKEPDPWRRLALFFEHGSNIARSGKCCANGMLQSDYSMLPEQVRTKLRSFDEAMRSWLSDILREGRSRGTMRFEGRPEDQALLVLAASQGALQQARVHGDDAFDAVRRQIERSLKGETV